jgi:hypothetical protein
LLGLRTYGDPLSCPWTHARQRAETAHNALDPPTCDHEEVPMLVTFRTKAYANITMFGDVAKQLLELMGHSGTVPSAIKAEDVPLALARLEAAIAQRKTVEGANARDDDRSRDGYDAPRKVTLSQRAVPLLELLRTAAAKKHDVMWDS